MCLHGSRKPVVINKRNVMLDECLADIVQALNLGGVKTAMSCCGHREADGFILLADEQKYRLLIVCPEGKESLDRFHADFRPKAEEFENRFNLKRGASNEPNKTS